MIKVEQDWMMENEGFVHVSGLPKDFADDGKATEDGEVIFETVQEAFDFLAEELPGIPVLVDIQPHPPQP